MGGELLVAGIFVGECSTSTSSKKPKQKQMKLTKQPQTTNIAEDPKPSTSKMLLYT